jgi:cytochrome c biogenesis protein CcdA/thiol-disulfide isomerase/thioredoxin
MCVTCAEQWQHMRKGVLALLCLFAVALAGLGLLWRAVPVDATTAVDVSGVAAINAGQLRAVSGSWAQGNTDLSTPPAAVTNPAGKPVVRFYLFYSDTCPHCHDIMNNYLPTVYEKYGDQVEYQYLNINNNTENYMTMLGVETKLGMPGEDQGYVPALVIGDKVLVGAQDIPAQLEGLIDQYLAQGGVDWISLENLPQVVLPTPAPIVQILLFFNPSQADFSSLNTFVTSLSQQYGSGLQPLAMDISQPANASQLDALNRALGVAQPAAGTPEVLIDRQLLVGMAAIQAKLPGLIDKYLARGGITVPPWEQLIGSAGGTPVPAATQTAPAPKPIYLAFFEQAGCQECARTTYDLELVKEQYPQVIVESFPVEDQQNKALNEWLCEKYGVPEAKRLSTPMIFVGQEVLIGTDANASNLLAAVGKYAATGAERTWMDFDATQAQQSLIDRFNSFGILTVLGAGLIDGLNPCAFATLVFFVSYLTFLGRRGRDILFVGLAFTAGVFVTYLLVGVGLLQVVQSLAVFTAFGRWVYLVTALLCVALAVFTFRDFSKARGGQAGEMTLKLPMTLRRRIHKVIRENAQVRAFVITAFVTGFVVSLLELACTGQVYLPTIMFVMSVPKMASRAFVYLLLYCVVFILGTTSEQMGRFVNRHTPTIKFATGLLFVGLALWMTWALAPLFGVHSPATWALMGGVMVLIAVGVMVWRLLERRPAPQPVTRRRRHRA